MNLSQELSVAENAALQAGRIISQYYKRKVAVDHKSPEQPVTVADREANDMIKSILLGAFPQDGWLSEETLDTSDRLKKDRCWIIDPLDGTKEFIAGIPEFAVSIGLSIKNQAVLGVVYNPVKDELYTAIKGCGAFFNRQKISTTQTSNLLDARFVVSRSETKRGDWKAFENQIGQLIISGGLAYKMCEVAKGSADASFSLSPKSEWDLAASVVIVEEAGGIVRTPDNSVFLLNQSNPKVKGIIYSNGPLYEPIRELIAKNL